MDIEDCGNVIEFVKTHVEFTRMELQESLGLSKSDAVYEIKKLIESSRIVKKRQRT